MNTIIVIMICLSSVLWVLYPLINQKQINISNINTMKALLELKNPLNEEKNSKIIKKHSKKRKWK